MSMGRFCKTCARSRLAPIEPDLAPDNPSPDAPAAETFDGLGAERLFAKVAGIFSALQEAIEQTRRKQDFRGLATLSGQGLRACDLLMRFHGKLPPGPEVNLLIAPQFHTLQAGLLRALAPYPAARDAVTLELQRFSDGAITE